jgi:hypothetical protein
MKSQGSRFQSITEYRLAGHPIFNPGRVGSVKRPTERAFRDILRVCGTIQLRIVPSPRALITVRERFEGDR